MATESISTNYRRETFFSEVLFNDLLLGGTALADDTVLVFAIFAEFFVPGRVFVLTNRFLCRCDARLRFRLSRRFQL